VTDLLNSGAQVEHQLSKNDQARQIGYQVFLSAPFVVTYVFGGNQP